VSAALQDALFPEELLAGARGLVEACRARGIRVATAESCTGGLISGLITEIAGSSAVLDRGFVSYSNPAKCELLDVPREVIDAHGAVSAPVAQALAEGALGHSRAELAVSVTGVAGPGGGTADKPVGLVWFGLAHHGGITQTEERRFGDIGRAAIRLESVRVALALLTPAE